MTPTWPIGPDEESIRRGVEKYGFGRYLLLSTACFVLSELIVAASLLLVAKLISLL